MARDLDDIFDGETRLPSEEVILAGHYRIVRELGRGAQGSVYLGEDLNFGKRRVAVKMPPAVLAGNKKAVATLRAEAEMAIRLSHPHIVTLRTFESTAEGVFLVMDHVEGRTLEDILADEGALPANRVYELFAPLAAALDYAHGEKVVHRDVKPSNILIRASDGKPLLTDFGIARELKDTMTRVTGKGTSGTLPYMSPEQLRGGAPAPAQDVYGLAATMYECLAGHPPFYRGEIAHQIETVEPEPLEPDSPFTRRIMRGLSKDAADRPGTCRGLMEEDGESIPAPSRSASPWILVAVTLVLVALLAIVLGRDSSPTPAPPPPPALHAPEAAREPEPDRPEPSAGPRDAVDPEFRWVEPDEGLVTGNDQVWVSAYVRDDHPPESVSVRVNGAGAEEARLGQDLKFRHLVTLRPGRNEITVTAEDASGNVGRTTRTVAVDTTAPRLEIPDGLEGSWTREPRLTFVVRLVDDHPRSVTCDGREARAKGDGRYECVTTLASQGANAIVLVGTDAVSLRTSPTSINVNLDSVAPVITFDPAAGPTEADRASVSGRVSEVGCSVTVEGHAATVTGLAFRVPVRLAVGTNRFEVVARDRLGNTSRQTVVVERRATPVGLPGYTAETSLRFAKLDRTVWQVSPKPRRNEQGMVEVEHRKTGLTFVLISAGSFRMGSESGEGDEKPVHEVTVPAFLLCKTECTQRAWDRMGGEDDRTWKGPDLPIEGVAWAAVDAWCVKVGLRLPSESEWEYACRAGSTGKWCFGNDESRPDSHAWFFINSGRRRLSSGTSWDAGKVLGEWGCRTHPVGKKEANAWGLHDMHGNVWEWCEDWYEGSYDKTPGDGSAHGNSGSGDRVVRGGSWSNTARLCRSANRGRFDPGWRYSVLGFRPAAKL